MNIQYATKKDLTTIAQCHIAAFPHSVTSLFGVEFISKMLEWYISAPNKFLFWIAEQNQCIGYCGGLVLDGSDAYGSASGMSQFGFNTAVKIMLRKPWLFFHPDITSRYPFIYTNVKRKIKKIFVASKPIGQQTKPIEPLLLTAGLVVIGVNPTHHKKGIGSLLQQEFELKAKAMGAKKMQLSVRKENEQAIASYKRNGWSIVDDQRISYGMVKFIG